MSETPMRKLARCWVHEHDETALAEYCDRVDYATAIAADECPVCGAHIITVHDGDLAQALCPACGWYADSEGGSLDLASLDAAVAGLIDETRQSYAATEEE